MFVVAQVSSIKTSRSGFRSGCSRLSSSRLAATSGRPRAAAMSTFSTVRRSRLSAVHNACTESSGCSSAFNSRERQVGCVPKSHTNPLRQRGPQRRPPPRQPRSTLVQLPPLLLHPTNPRLTDVEVRRDLAGTPASITGSKHRTTALRRIRFQGHRLGDAHAPQTARRVLVLFQARSTRGAVAPRGWPCSGRSTAVRRSRPPADRRPSGGWRRGRSRRRSGLRRSRCARAGGPRAGDRRWA